MSRTVQVAIQSVAYGGSGVARVQGQVVFIPYTVTGDEALIEVVEEKKSYAMGRLVEIRALSPWRTSPACPSFGRCGGCTWQHIDLTKQAEIKKEILKETLIRLGRLVDLPPLTLLPSPVSYGYRNRIQLKVKGERIGYYRERSHDILNIDHCPIAHPLIQQILSSIREALPSFPALRKAEAIEINVSPQEGKGILLLHFPSIEHRDIRSAAALLSAHPLLKGILLKTKKDRVLCGHPFLSYTVPVSFHGECRDLGFRVSPGSFTQIHPEQNRVLIQSVLDLSRVMEREHVLDLYAGIGNFTLPLALLSRKATGIEESESAVSDARFNARANGIGGVTFIRNRVKECLSRWSGGKPDLIVLDPPRTGAMASVDRIASFHPERIVYVSCDPSTLARDLRLFAERGFSLHAIHLVDMFPQTYHMEVVALLRSPC